VRAIQAIMGMSSPYKHILDNGYWNSYAKQIIPYGRFVNIKELENWLNQITETTTKKWSIERIECEWTIRLRHIENYMATASNFTNNSNKPIKAA